MKSDTLPYSMALQEKEKLIMGPEVLASALVAMRFICDDGHNFVLKTICQL